MLKRFSLFAGGIAVLAFVAIGFSSYSSSPTFCRSCHNMEPYYQSWKESKHSGITCTKCHFDPGIVGTLRGKFEASALVVKYLTGTYSPKPFAHIEDASCLQAGCHVKEKLGETKPFKGKAEFNHQPHFKEGLENDLKCTSCHSPLKIGKHISVNEMRCYLCHLQEFDSTKTTADNSDTQCALCHKKLPKLIELGKRNIEHETIAERKVNCYECHSDVVKGRGTVKESTCYNCHNFEERVVVKGKRVELHRIHAAKHLECFLCHEDIKHRSDPKAKVAGSDCKSCHLAKHSGIKTLYSGRGGLGTPDRPGPMFQAGVDCIGCHDSAWPALNPDFKGQSKIALKKRCVECHNNDKRYGEILEQWKEIIEKRLNEVASKMEKAKFKFGKKPDDQKIARLMENASYNYYFVNQSVGIHNVGYSLNLLEAAENSLNLAMGLEIRGEVLAVPKEKGIFWFVDTEGLDPVRFDHSLHQTMSPECGDCHDRYFDMDFGSADSLGLLTMSNMIRGKYCGGCHNGEGATAVTEDCTFCHIKPDDF